MTLLAPLALGVGAIAALGAVVLHLVARRRPAVVPFPTARFIVDRRSLVSAVVSRPRDMVLLALRVATFLAAGAAFARPVSSPSGVALGRVVLLDRSGAVASSAEALSRARTLLDDRVPSRLVAFDTAAVALPLDAATLDSLAAAPFAGAPGSISAALVAGRRAAASIGARADSVDLVLLSPIARSELDDATPTVRRQWPGRISWMRLALRADTAAVTSLERTIPLDDPRGPAAVALRVGTSSRSVRLRTSPLTPQDSAFARSGGTLVVWDSGGAVAPAALVAGDDVVVASFARKPVPADGRIVARWADGSAAATETTLGQGCVRTVGVGLPTAGDLPLRRSFQRVVRGLLASCAAAASYSPPDSTTLAWLNERGSMASGSALASTADQPTPLVPWLLALAVGCAIAELFVRARHTGETP